MRFQAKLPSSTQENHRAMLIKISLSPNFDTKFAYPAQKKYAGKAISTD
jgi:hypothetical protein